MDRAAYRWLAGDDVPGVDSKDQSWTRERVVPEERMSTTVGRTFDQLWADIATLFDAARYQEAYDLLAVEGPMHPRRAPLVLYLRSCAAARLERLDLAVSLIGDALDQGFWYSNHVLRD